MEHPITPPLELVHQWRDKWYDDKCTDFSMFLATQAARWGADQELEACSEWLLDSAPWTVDPNERPEWVQTLKRCRRPKSPSLAEQALDVLKRSCFVNPVHENIIRCALVRLQELENHQ